MSLSESPGSRVRNARGDGARLRDEIVDAAAALLESGPAESITLRAVARTAGITAPSIYRHFDSVDAILRAVIERTFAELEVRLTDAVAHETGAEQIWSVSRAYFTFALEHPEQYRLLFGGAWNAANLDPDQHVERRERESLGLETMQILIDAIAAASAEGSSTSTDHTADAVALWVGLHGLATLRRATPLFPWPTDIERRVIQTLAHLGDADQGAAPRS